MKRSEVNEIMVSAEKFMGTCGFYLPSFAQWTASDWQKKGPEVSQIVENGLGWDVTDFGSGNFLKQGLFLFTLRNGNLSKTGQIPYAEKIMVVEEKQITPMHFHWHKTEDIINRNGGSLCIQLFLATSDEKLDEKNEIRVVMDGEQKIFPAGKIVALKPGESITLTPRLYHSFWAEGGRALVGEVSSVNDDAADNRFYLPAGRFPTIEEDEPPVHLLVSDYPRYYRK